jgi:hypothetical protein
MILSVEKGQASMLRTLFWIACHLPAMSYARLGITPRDNLIHDRDGRRLAERPVHLMVRLIFLKMIS